MHKSGINVPFKHRFGKFIHNDNVFRKDNTKMFTDLTGIDPNQTFKQPRKSVIDP